MMRSGRQRNDKNSLPTPTTTVQKQRLAQSQSNPVHTNRPNKRAHFDNDDDMDFEDEDDDLDNDLTEATPDSTDTDSLITPNLTNYHELGMQWGPSRAEKHLADLKLHKNNQMSGMGLYEAQALQSQYELDKTMLCIVLKVSRRVMDDALLEGPLAREPNMYNNYQTYSKVATLTSMPPKGVSEGFSERNKIVGSTWSTYVDEEQDVFTPRLFERLCVATSEAYALTTTPLGISASVAVQEATPDTRPSDLEPLTQEELETYVPIFERLVNLQKVLRDLHQGRLWRHSGKSTNRSSELLMRREISKIIRQLNVLVHHFNLQFHLMIACWNPGTSNARALYQSEHTSCERWVWLQQKKHLLECFTFESTKAPGHLRAQHGDPKPQTESAARQAAKRSELATSLNDLIAAPYLTGGYKGKGDAHPKCSNLGEAFAKKNFQGNVALGFHCTSDSQVTDEMISKGPGCLTNDEVEAWLKDIESNNYTIIKVENTKTKKRKTKKREKNDQLTAAEAALDDEETIPEKELQPTSLKSKSRPAVLDDQSLDPSLEEL
ncbi:uncharacterized protein MELLADRAFT_85639 [Melampsora larici-populina 98AG31]|uniref:Uncharacterized protein n=1 Tax=Melampsora larici-populina (strain 98AG31 / pathotype 3-4-7) TaxID=747676 RepID=F4RJA0_MELLP|nr:uncharacterized protein MELLADRAFT_85639 [Melampsora larici-populina 98AG31]EGG07280.1 hypothetical protein MELLADRAFT_85639 [Melampsora larici-populina 98AG31]